jgi:hypothetical protein
MAPPPPPPAVEIRKLHIFNARQDSLDIQCLRGFQGEIANTFSNARCCWVKWQLGGCTEE